MQTLIFLILVFLIVVFSILLYFKTKHSRVDKLKQGTCPSCGESTKVFTDPNTNTRFKSEVITARLLKGHGCAGSKEIEYRCKACGLKEVYTQ